MKEIEKVIAVIVTAGLLWLGWTAFQCWWRPLVDCWCCKGMGRHRKGRFSRACWWCKGAGSRVRLGRRVWTKLGIAKNKLVG